MTVTEVSTFGELVERHEREIFAYALRLPAFFPPYPETIDL